MEKNPPASAPTEQKGILSAVSSEPNKGPLRIMLYGQEGVGKTTWAAQIPRCLFLSCEDGSGDLEIPTIKIGSWSELIAAVDSLIDGGVGEYRAVVLDTASGFERLCWEHLLIKAEDSSMESKDYGKSYTMAAEEQSRLIARLNRLRDVRRVHIVFLCHAITRVFNDPTGPSYDLWQPALHKDASPIFVRWADALLFAGFEASVKIAKRNKEADASITQKGKVASVTRMLLTTRNSGYMAKNRYSLPEELPLEWPAFAKAIRWQQRERAFHPLHSLQDTFADRVLGLSPKASPAQVQAAEKLLMRGKTFAELSFKAAHDAKAKLEAISAEALLAIIAPALGEAPATAPTSATDPAATAAASADAAEAAELEQHSAYEAVRKAFVARCLKINGEEPGEEELATASAEVKLGGPWAQNDSSANRLLIGRWASMSDEVFSAMISPFITTLGF